MVVEKSLKTLPKCALKPLKPEGKEKELDRQTDRSHDFQGNLMIFGARLVICSVLGLALCPLSQDYRMSCLPRED